MEADWEAEIGSDAPVIDAHWDGFIDLVQAPERIAEIEEARRFVSLQRALLVLNASDSPVWTSKCDIWRLEEFEPSEMDASAAECTTGLGCYIDILPRSGSVFTSLFHAESWARALTKQLRQIPMRGCRVDLVIRQAFAGASEGQGITAYITACGETSESTAAALASALDLFAANAACNTP